MLKLAADQQFEKTFADLAYSSLQDRSPKLLDYLIGFQMLDKNDDDTKGAGIFIFDIGGTPYYGPVFFLNGELKGNQLLYAKKSNQFMPLQEKWVTYIINSRRQQLGNSAGEKVQGSSPDLDIYRNPPMSYKTASEKVEAVFGDILTTALGDFDGFDLNKTLPMLSKEAKVALASTMRGDEKFAEAIIDFYDVDALLKTASYERPIYAPSKDPYKGMEIITALTKSAAELDKEETTSMARDGVVIRDLRDETTPVFDGANFKKDTDLVTTQFSNAEPGIIANVLLADGNLRKSIIVREVTGRCHHDYDKHETFNFAENDVLVIPLDGKEQTIKTAIQQVFVPTSELATAKEEFMEWFYKNSGSVVSKKAPNDPHGLKIYGESTITAAIDQNGIAVGMKGLPSFASLAVGTVINQNGIYVQDQTYYFSNNEPDGIKTKAHHYTHKPSTITITNGTSIKVMGDTVCVPKYCVSISLNQVGEDSVTLGNPHSLAFDALKGSDFEKIKITSDGIEYTITDNDGQTKPVNKSAAIIKLATAYGINGAMASQMVNSVTKGYAGRGQAKFIIKRAGFGDVDKVNYDSDLGTMARQPEMNFDTVDSMQAGPAYDDQDKQLSDKARKAAIDAASTGNKEVLDTAILTGLIDASGATSIIDGYMKTLLAGLDRVGRIMFLFYWHDDKFRERYGDQDIKALEDSLITVFDSLGDLILFLKEKTANIDTLLTSGNLELDGSV